MPRQVVRPQSKMVPRLYSGSRPSSGRGRQGRGPSTCRGLRAGPALESSSVTGVVDEPPFAAPLGRRKGSRPRSGVCFGVSYVCLLRRPGAKGGAAPEGSDGERLRPRVADTVVGPVAGGREGRRPSGLLRDRAEGGGVRLRSTARTRRSVGVLSRGRERAQKKEAAGE